MLRSPSTVWFLLTLTLALALVCWWTVFQLGASQSLAAAGAALEAGDTQAAAEALGAASPTELQRLARARHNMFLSEGVAFAAILAIVGLLYAASQRREARLRADQDRFLAGATHELKTPLATIQLLLESLRDGRVPEQKRARYLESGLLEAHRLERGLTNLLTAAGLRASLRPQAQQPGDLAADLHSAILAMTARAEAAGVTLACGELPATPVRRDPEALQLVLRNLLDNAIKYSPPGSTVHVEITADGADAVLAVRDHGCGMDQETIANAFAPFWRGKDPASGGTGLGLHLVQELVQAHGGRVVARSDGPGHGSTFTVRLPRQVAA